MRLALVPLLVLAPVAWAGELDELQRCKLGEPAGCRDAAKRAERQQNVELARSLRERATALERSQAVKDRGALLETLLPERAGAGAPVDERPQAVPLVAPASPARDAEGDAPATSGRAAMDERTATVPLVTAEGVVLPSLARAEAIDERASTVPLVAADAEAGEPDARAASDDVDHALEADAPPARRRSTPPTPRDADEPMVDDLRELDSPRSSMSSARFGVLALAAGEGLFALNGGGSGMRWRVGGGARLSLTPRTGQEHELLPTVGLLLGAVGDSRSAGFFSELRVEMLLTSTASIAQARFTLYALSGFQVYGAVEPYVGLGLGWNWLPQGGGHGGGAFSGLAELFRWPGTALGVVAVLLVGLAIIPVIFAGRLELRYYPTAAGVGPGSVRDAPSALALMVGIGA